MAAVWEVGGRCVLRQSSCGLRIGVERQGTYEGGDIESEMRVGSCRLVEVDLGLTAGFDDDGT